MLQRLKSMTRGEIEDSFDISGKKGKEGTTFRAGQYAVKLFKSTKASSKVKTEADLQSMAAAKGVAPVVHYVSTTQKFIVMDALSQTIVDKGKREKWTKLPEAYAAQLYALCKRLDAAGVVQNDGNPLNLMLDGNGRMYIIDYGFAKKITAAVKKKRGSQPNVNLTLWHFSRQMRHYRFENNLTERIVNKYMKDNSFVDQELLDKGERLLGPIGAAPAAVVKAPASRKKKPPAAIKKKSPPPAVTPPPMGRKKKPPALRKKKPPTARKKKPVVTETPVARKKKTNRVILESDTDDSDDSDWVPEYDDSDSDDSDSDEDRDTSASRKTAPSKKKGQRAHYRQHVQKDTTLEERIRARKNAFKKYKLSKD